MPTPYDQTSSMYGPLKTQLESDRSNSPGFNGQWPDTLTGHYLLGNGYRAYNPVLMRFNCPDSESPFGEGGFNTYAYCAGDPANRTDPTGHLFKRLRRWLRGNRTPQEVADATPSVVVPAARPLPQTSHGPNASVLNDPLPEAPINDPRPGVHISDPNIRRGLDSLRTMLDRQAARRPPSYTVAQDKNTYKPVEKESLLPTYEDAIANIRNP